MHISESSYRKMTGKPPRDVKARKKPVYKTSESAVKAACMGWLALNKVFTWRNNTGAFKTEKGFWVKFGKVGSADIIGMTPKGRFLAIETKSSTGTLKDEQITFKQAVEQNGGLYIVARSTDDLEKHKGLLI